MVIAILLLTGQFVQATTQRDSIKWMSLEEALLAVAQEPKKILVEVYADWCVWCKKMEQQTFQDEYISRYINENFYPVRFDAQQKETVRFRGNAYRYVKSNNGGYHELAAELLKGRLSFPAIVFIDEDTRPIQSISGYKSPMQFLQIVTYFGENHHRNTPWSTYKESFVPDQQQLIRNN